MKIVNTGSTYRIYTDDLKTYDKLPVGTYEVCFHPMQGFWLERKDNIELTEKVYGIHNSKADKILKSFKITDRNLGVILSGNKGIGKSLTAKLIVQKAIAAGIPVIVVNDCIKGVASYIADIKQEVVVLFDEFDKTFKVNKRNDDGGDQDEFLTLFDGLDQGKKLFIVTCNSLSDLSDYLVNRPGRFHYHLRFNYPSVDEIKEYLHDKLHKKYWGEIEEVVKFANITDLNYDCLRAIAFELNLGTSFKEAIKDLNITNYDNDSKYDIICVLDNGMRSIRKNFYIDLNREDNTDLSFNFPALKDYVTIELDPSMCSWNTIEGCDVCPSDVFSNVYWRNGLSTNKIINTDSQYYDSCDYCDDDVPTCVEDNLETDSQAYDDTADKRQPRPKVVSILFKRKSSYRNIHYAI